MIALIYDSETTGLDPATDRIVQHGCIVYDLASKKVLDTLTILCWSSDFPTVAESKSVHGWEAGTLQLHAVHPGEALQRLTAFWFRWKCKFVVAHNGCKFDRNMLEAEYTRGCSPDSYTILVEETPILAAPWLDSLAHIDYPGCPGKALLTIAAHNGFLNPFPHDALSDCYTLATILNKNPTMILSMAKQAAAPKAIVFANIPPKIHVPTNKALKALKFRWQDWEGHSYPGSWIKLIDRKDLESTIAAGAAEKIQINLVKDIPAESGYPELYCAINSFYEDLWHK